MAAPGFAELKTFELSEQKKQWTTPKISQMDAAETQTGKQPDPDPEGTISGVRYGPS